MAWVQTLRWLRLVGDITFAGGVGALGWFLAGLWFGWSTESAPARHRVEQTVAPEPATAAV